MRPLDGPQRAAPVHPAVHRGEDALRAGAEDIAAAVAEGALEVGEEHGLPLVSFPLEETAAAHDAVENGAVGKVLIDVADLD